MIPCDEIIDIENKFKLESLTLIDVMSGRIQYKTFYLTSRSDFI